MDVLITSKKAIERVDLSLDDKEIAILLAALGTTSEAEVEGSYNMYNNLYKVLQEYNNGA